jgi:predicted dienelactone hydrolase
VEIFYPADESARSLPRHTFTVADGLSAPALLLVGAHHATHPLPSTAVRDAKPHAGRFPLVLFSHGAGGFRLQSYPWLEQLASHGYVVATVEHPGDTFSDFVLLGRSAVELRLVVANLYRRDDVPFVLESMLADQDFGTQIDVARIGAFGHSHGAVSTVQLLRRDARVRAAVLHGPPQCPILDLPFLGTAVADLRVPILIQAGDMDLTTTPAITDSAWGCFQRPKVRERYAHVGHFTFSIACRLPRPLLESASQRAGFDLIADGCSEQNLSIADADREIGAHLVAHFNVTLRDSPSSAKFLLQSWLKPGETRHDAVP